MTNTTIDRAVLTKALTDIAQALEGIEQSVRAGTRLRASYVKAMLDAVNSLVADLEEGG